MTSEIALAFIVGFIGGMLFVVSVIPVLPSHICIEAKAKGCQLEQCLLETKENGGGK